jgi:hypothetical protein
VAAWALLRIDREFDAMTNRLSTRLGASTALALALALSACNKPADTNAAGATGYASTAALPALPPTLPLATGAATAISNAPAVTALPAAKPVNLVRVANPGDDYAYADDAASFSDAIGDAPPDYGFDYDGTQPWAWQGYDDSETFVEPVDDGYRYYYYRPGDDYPYFVRDPDYGYGYDDGALAAVYGPDGAILPYGDYGPRRDYASRYYARGRALYAASRRHDHRRAVIAANWAQHSQTIDASRQRWAEQRGRQQGWQAYHDRVAAQQDNHWQEEQARRRADSVRFADWRQSDFRTSPPPRAIPQSWQSHPWAQDATRFAPAAHGFNGDAAQRQQAAQVERQRIVDLAQQHRQAAAHGGGQPAQTTQPAQPRQPDVHHDPANAAQQQQAHDAAQPQAAAHSQDGQREAAVQRRAGEALAHQQGANEARIHADQQRQQRLQTNAVRQHDATQQSQSFARDQAHASAERAQTAQHVEQIRPPIEHAPPAPRPEPQFHPQPQPQSHPEPAPHPQPAPQPQFHPQSAAHPQAAPHPQPQPHGGGGHDHH